MSEFVYLFRTTEAEQREAMGEPETARRSMGAWMEWIRDLEARGKIKDWGKPLDPKGRVMRGKKRLVTDGPFAETKDIVLGFMVVEAKDLAEATELASDCPMLDGAGSVEIRPVGAMPG
ncbi:MAG TPA: YciI family protein [Myxococcaceae bacterium]|nr:YciI family protein [Myxococcaceae bacterium]